MEDFYVLPTIYVTRQSTPRSSSVKNFASKYCGTRSGILENRVRIIQWRFEKAFTAPTSTHFIS